MSTAGALIAAVRGRLGISSTESLLNTEALLGCVNDALSDLNADLADGHWYDRKHTFSTVAGTDTYDLPATLRKIKSVSVDGWELEQGSDVDFDSWDGTWEARSFPQWFALEQNKLGLRPTPTAVQAVVVRYRCWENTLVNQTDEPLLPAIFDQAIVQGACRYAMQITSETTRQTTFAAGYEAAMRRAQKLERKTDGPRRPRVRPGGGL